MNEVGQLLLPLCGEAKMLIPSSYNILDVIFDSGNRTVSVDIENGNALLPSLSRLLCYVDHNYYPNADIPHMRYIFRCSRKYDTVFDHIVNGRYSKVNIDIFYNIIFTQLNENRIFWKEVFELKVESVMDYIRNDTNIIDEDTLHDLASCVIDQGQQLYKPLMTIQNGKGKKKENK